MEENKKVFEQIAKITEELKNMKKETELLYDRLNNRQEYILEKVRACITQKIKEILPENNNQMVYDEDEMKTGSSPSSVGEEEEVEEEQPNEQQNNLIDNEKNEE